jgi:hypothetical protein
MSAIRKIRSVEAKPNYILAINWERGGAAVDLSDFIKRGGVFEPLSDVAKFELVRLTENKTGVEWPYPADEDGYPIVSIDAEALFVLSVSQNNARKVKSLDSIMKTIRDNGKLFVPQRS